MLLGEGKYDVDFEVNHPRIKPDITGWPTVQQTLEKAPTNSDPGPVPTVLSIVC